MKNPGQFSVKINKQPLLPFATERAALHQHDLAFGMAVKVQFDAIELFGRVAVSDDRPGHVIRFDPLFRFRQFGQDGHGRIIDDEEHRGKIE